MEDKVLTTTEAAKLLGISVRTAQLLIESGGLPSWKTPGGHRRVHRSDVEAFMEQSHAGEPVASASVYVITTAERQPELQKLIDTVGYVVAHFFPNTWLAAVAAGARAPALVVVDLDACKDEGVELLRTLASDGRLKNTRLIGLTTQARNRSGPLPGRVHQVSPATLPETVRLLTEDSPDLISRVVQGDFPVAPNEASRLQAVQRSGLLNTPAEEPFDRVTWLAAWGLKSPIALMSVLTPDLQWFKSRQGLELAETPRSWAFCNHTILQKGVFEVRDLSAAPQFAQNPAVADAPHFRFYAGAPVYDPDGFALGSICIVDFRPRRLDPGQKRTLLELAAIATDEIRLREATAKA